MGNYKIVVAGHEGNLSLTWDNNTKSFSGTFTSDEGTGSVSGIKDADGTLRGTAYLGAHQCGFVANIDGGTITGSLHVAWLIDVSFEGVAV